MTEKKSEGIWWKARGPRDMREHSYQGGMIVERVRAFVENPDLDELVNWGAGPRKQGGEIPEAVIKSDVGTSGIFCALEPSDMNAYASFLREPLSMPDRPEVAVVTVDYNTARPHSSSGYRPPAPEAIVPWPGSAVAPPGARAVVGLT